MSVGLKVITNNFWKYFVLGKKQLKTNIPADLQCKINHNHSTCNSFKIEQQNYLSLALINKIYVLIGGRRVNKIEHWFSFYVMILGLLKRQQEEWKLQRKTLMEYCGLQNGQKIQYQFGNLPQSFGCQNPLVLIIVTKTVKASRVRVVQFNDIR